MASRWQSRSMSKSISGSSNCQRKGTGHSSLHSLQHYEVHAPDGTGMAEGSTKTAWARDKVFALDWRGLAEKGVLGDVLRLFGFRYAWLKDGDQKAHLELERAAKAADPNIREAARLILSEAAAGNQPKDSLVESPKGGPVVIEDIGPGSDRAPRYKSRTLGRSLRAQAYR